jgi:hypothetical protein
MLLCSAINKKLYSRLPQYTQHGSWSQPSDLPPQRRGSTRLFMESVGSFCLHVRMSMSGESMG